MIRELVYEMRGSLGIIRMDRPHVLNALTPAIMEGIRQHVERLGAMEEVRAIALTGTGERAFAAGCDVESLSRMGRDEIASFIDVGHRTCMAIESCGKPVIAVVDGYAVGGGFELVLACDMAIATPSSTFGFPETRLGIIPGFGGTQRLPRRVGVARAADIIYRGRSIDAATALAWGLVNEVVDRLNLWAAVDAVVADLIRTSAPAIRYAKQSILTGIDRNLSEGLAIERESFLASSEFPNNSLSLRKS